MKRVLLTLLFSAWSSVCCAQFTPTDVSGLKLWLKADAGVYEDAGTDAAEDTDAVQQWNDQSGQGNHVSQATSGKRPQFRTNQLNSLPSIIFTRASAQWLKTTANIDAKAVYVIGKNTATNVFSAFAGGDTSASISVGAWYFMSQTNTGSGSFQRATSADGAASTDFAAFSAPGTGYRIFSGRITGTNTAIDFAINGKAAATDTTGNSLRAVGGGGTLVGSAWYNDSESGNELGGEICEILVYDSELSTADHEKILQYLTARWFTEPTWVLSVFEPSGETLRILGSSDGETFTLADAPSFTPTVGTCRDPQILKRVNGSDLEYFMCYTTGGLSTSTSFGIARGPTWRGPWSTIANVDCSSIADGASPQTWSPIWFVHNNAPYILVSIRQGDNSNFRQYYLSATNDPATDDLDSWSAPTEISSLTAIRANIIAGQIVKRGANWYCFYKKESATQYNEIAVSSTGPFTGYSAHQQALWGPDWADATSYEGVSVWSLGGASWRAYFDDHLGTGLHYSNSTDDWATWSTPTVIGGSFSFTPRNGLPMLTYTYTAPSTSTGNMLLLLGSYRTNHPRHHACWGDESKPLFQLAG